MGNNCSAHCDREINPPDSYYHCGINEPVNPDNTVGYISDNCGELVFVS